MEEAPSGSLVLIRASYSVVHLQAGEVVAKRYDCMGEAWRLDSFSLLPITVTTGMVPCLAATGPALVPLPSLASWMTLVKFLNISAVPLQRLSKTVAAPTTACPPELTCKELPGRLEPLVLWWPFLLFRVAGCCSQLSPGWLIPAPPFLLAYVLLTSGFGWEHLAQSETAVRDAQFAVETSKLSW